MIETKFKQTEIGLIPEDWNTKTIGEISYFYNGTAHESIVDENGRWILVNSKFISTESEVVKHVSKCLHPCYINDILMVMSDVPNGKAIAKCFIVNEDNKYSLNQRICRFSIFNGNPRFIYYALNRNPYYLSFDDGVKQTNLSKKEVINCPLSFPPLEEQSRIASAMTSIDNLLSSLDKLIAKKRDIKQGAMQQLLTGKTRLKGFTEPWVYYSVGSDCCVKARIGWQGLTTSEYLEHGEYGLITSTDIVNYKVDWQTCCFVSEYRYAQDPNIIVQNGDVLISKDGTIGKVGIVSNIPFPCTLNSGVFVIRSKSPQISQEGLGLVFLSPYFADFIKRLTAGSTIVHLYQKDIVNFTFPMPPTIKEQQAIAAVLSSMDNEIAALEAKRKKYEAVKQGMMQQLLTGKIRLL
jgi:type I restriction enzyme S subunit